MSTIFEKIIVRELPGHFVYEDEVCAVILDKFPAVPGQTIVIPRNADAYLFDVADETYHHLWQVTKKVAAALDEVFETERTCIVVEGFEVPHVHIKLYPMTTIEPLGAVMPQQKEADDQTLAAQAEKIAAALGGE